MSITSLLFIFAFLPLSLGLYYMSNDSVKEYVLLAVSLFFYSICSVSYILLFIISIFVTVLIGRNIKACMQKWGGYSITFDGHML